MNYMEVARVISIAWLSLKCIKYTVKPFIVMPFSDIRL